MKAQRGVRISDGGQRARDDAARVQRETLVASLSMERARKRLADTARKAADAEVAVLRAELAWAKAEIAPHTSPDHASRNARAEARTEISVLREEAAKARHEAEQAKSDYITVASHGGSPPTLPPRTKLGTLIDALQPFYALISAVGTRDPDDTVLCVIPQRIGSITITAGQVRALTRARGGIGS